MPAGSAADAAGSGPAACVDGARLDGRLFGAIETTLDWAGDSLDCEGMPRPNDRGARLRFAGSPAGDAGGLALIVALPGYTRAATGEAFGARVTVIEEGAGRFFSSGDGEACWADIVSSDSVGEDRERPSGRIYCIRPLTEVNGDSSLTVGELEFTGIIDWSAS